MGILMLDTRFPRIVGDIGNAASFDFPVIFRRMDGIGSADAVTAHPDRPRVLAA
ncbi:MAG: aspartate/glutamate racemase family protein, partial [Alphaproteobacteria bacterium]|nr:aspartate/glutamate racemase family protein [Alphaproteobacteria bacterium]